MKFIAWHLPQFHTIPENDKWWGKGFTEWVNVKKAKPIFKNHYQPRVPLNNNYYDLSDINEIKKQCDLANQYGVYGFCFYHYWFNGKLLLEKPIEQLMQNKDININYCLSWANEPWTRAWDGITSEVIMPQYYGDKKEWKEHYNYLRQFFNDERYICVDGKPMLLIYRTENIPNCDEMINYWNILAQKDGFPGLHIVKTLTYFQEKPVCVNSNAMVYMEPTFQSKESKTEARKRLIKTIFKYRKKMRIEDYDDVWKKIIKRDVLYYENKKTYLGSFVDWDNTARKKENGRVIHGATPEKFEKYTKAICEKSKEDFIFINAWNEWAEGTYLEPDNKFGYKYLQALKNINDQVKE